MRAFGIGALDIGALDIGALDIGALGFGALGFGAVGIAALGCVAPLRAVEIVAVGDSTCARFDSGRVHCWGANPSGVLGSGDGDSDSEVPVAVPGIRDSVALAVAADHACAVRANGELGDGSRTPRAMPGPVLLH